MASVLAPLKLSYYDTKDAPEAERDAIALLQAKGYTVLRKPPLEIGALCDVTIFDFHGLPQEELARRTIVTLGTRLGQEAVKHATVSAETNSSHPVLHFHVIRAT